MSFLSLTFTRFSCLTFSLTSVQHHHFSHTTCKCLVHQVTLQNKTVQQHCKTKSFKVWSWVKTASIDPSLNFDIYWPSLRKQSSVNRENCHQKRTSFAQLFCPLRLGTNVICSGSLTCCQLVLELCWLKHIWILLLFIINVISKTAEPLKNEIFQVCRFLTCHEK